jgi:hypothetical protein
MRTKTLLIAAAALVAGIISSNAQVYSANVVGYINVSLTNGYTMCANQLDYDGTGTNNSIYTCIGTNLPVNTQVLVWNGSGFSSTKLLASGKWSLNNSFVTNAMAPGAGFFVNSSAITNFVELGTVVQGTNTLPIVAGYQVVSPIPPITGGIGTTFGYVPSKNDQALVWNGVGYTSHKYTGSSWTAGEPTFSIGQAIFLNASSNNAWTQGFKVQ